METLELSPTYKRIFSMDVIRGIALMGILFINICEAGLPGAYDSGAIHFFNLNPTDYYAWFIVNMTIEGKMRCLFSILFGAGVILFTSKIEEQGKKSAGLYYRRMLWLLLFGLIDAYLILWTGDILLEYAFCGLLLFPLRKLKPIYLIIIAFVMLGWVSFFSNMSFSDEKGNRETYLQTEQLLKEGKKITPEQEEGREAWLQREKYLYPFSKETIQLVSANIAKDINQKRQGYTDLFLTQAPENFEEEYSAFTADVWETLAAMIIGMVLLKWGFFQGTWSIRKYLLTAVICLSLGTPVAYSITYWPHAHTAHDFVNYIDSRSFDLAALEQIPRILMAIGYAALIMIVCMKGWFKKVSYALSCLGKMAFTNYMIQNIFITTFFFGHGFAQFGNFTRMELFYIMALTWVIQITFSVLWLRKYNMGPLEWLWRSLTYKKIIPNKIQHD